MVLSWHPRPTTRQRSGVARRGRLSRRERPCVEVLETRDLPSAVTPRYIRLRPEGPLQPFGGSGPSGYTPAQIRHAYGFDQLTFPGGAAADGSGTTIAIVDAFDDPHIVSSSASTFSSSDLHNFDVTFGLPEPAGFFTKVDQTGGSNYPAMDPGWSSEIALDVEWAHAIAPKAKILLVEANDNSFDSLVSAVQTAAKSSGVVAVSMSWGGGEFLGEDTYDSTLSTPAGHGGVTFLASSGDYGAPPSWPAVSAHVVAVGGTTLNLDASNNISSETGWSGSGGGISSILAQPSYQIGVVTQDPNFRTNPDVAYDSDPYTGFPVYETINNDPSAPWSQFGGTSDASPQWAGLIAIADQGRALAGETALDGVTQTLPMLYKAPASDFNDITSGSSYGFPVYSAGPGYDLVTGRGTPVVPRLVSDLIGNATPPSAATHFSLAAPSSTPAGSAFSITVTALDASNNPVTNYAGRVHFSSSDPAAGLPADYTFTTADQGHHTFSVTLGTVGSQTVKAADTFYTSITGTATLTVTAGAASQFRVTGFPSPAAAGVAGSFTVTATDAYGNPSPGYAGTIHFTSSDALAVLPANAPLTNGSGTFSATLKTAGTQSLTATDTSNASFTGTQSGILVKPAAATHLVFGQQPTSTPAGSAIAPAVTVKLLDTYNNLVTTDNTDSVKLALSGPSGATLSGTNPVTVQGGVATFSNLSVNLVGTGYFLTASSGTLTGATSNTFNITLPSTIIEDFESFNALQRYTVVGATLTTDLVWYTAAHNGDYGLDTNSSSNWIYRSDAAATVRRGDTISVWVQLANTADGRASFGFGASSSGTLSVVLAANTQQLLIQNNASWVASTLAAVSQKYQASHWYRVQVNWGSSGSITVQLFDSNGSTQLNTVTTATSPITTGGIGFRSTGGEKYFDTVTVIRGGSASVAPRLVTPVAGDSGVPVVSPPADSILAAATPGSDAVPPARSTMEAGAFGPSELAPMALGRFALTMGTTAASGPSAATLVPSTTTAATRLITPPATAPSLTVTPLPSRSRSAPLDGGGDSAQKDVNAFDEESESRLLEQLLAPGSPNPPAAVVPPQATRGSAGAVPGVEWQSRTFREDNNAASRLAGVGSTAETTVVERLVQRPAAPAAAAATTLVLVGLWAQGSDRASDRRQRLES
jgi:hypothetical protein